MNVGTIPAPCSKPSPGHAIPGALPRSMLLDLSRFTGLVDVSQPSISSHTAGNERFQISRFASDGGTRPVQEVLRFVSLASHILSTGQEVGAKLFSEEVPGFLPARNVFLKAQPLLSGSPSLNFARHTKTTAYRQARNNSRNLSNITSVLTHRQLLFPASYGRRNWCGSKGRAAPPLAQTANQPLH